MIGPNANFASHFHQSYRARPRSGCSFRSYRPAWHLRGRGNARIGPRLARTALRREYLEPSYGTRSNRAQSLHPTSNARRPRDWSPPRSERGPPQHGRGWAPYRRSAACPQRHELAAVVGDLPPRAAVIPIGRFVGEPLRMSSLVATVATVFAIALLPPITGLWNCGRSPSIALATSALLASR